MTVAGGIGGQKWRDRRLLAELAVRAGASADEHVLITDETGEILETDKANVFAVIDGVLLTPPADGRLLPGTTRAAVMRAAREHGIRVGQKPLTLDELASASEVFVTNAVVGVLPVTAIDGLPASWPRPANRDPRRRPSRPPAGPRPASTHPVDPSHAASPAHPIDRAARPTPAPGALPPHRPRNVSATEPQPQRRRTPPGRSSS